MLKTRLLILFLLGVLWHRILISSQLKGAGSPISVSLGRAQSLFFLSGFKSDMQGRKALHLAQWAARSGRSFLRFDYSGHGQSSGLFCDGCIGDWLTDAEAVITELTEGPVILGGLFYGRLDFFVTRTTPWCPVGRIGHYSSCPRFHRRPAFGLVL